MKRLVLSALAAAALGCSHSAATPPADRPQSPLQLRWEERARTATGARLVAHVQRLAPMPLPLWVRLELPAGVKLRQGRARFELAANRAADEVAEEVVLSYDAAPAEDLVLHADGESKVAGFHGLATYRFGRAEPRLEAVPATGPHVLLNGRDLGPSVPLDGAR